jgi:3',5'-cyclic AMP phosphodiesterase CpdA
MKEFFLKNWKKLALFFGILTGIIFLSLGIFFWKFDKKEINIGVIADIHAGSQDLREEGMELNNILIPSNFEKNIKNALGKMKGSDLIITLGDNLNSPSEKYLEKLKKSTSEYPLIWTKGNHDKKALFSSLSPKNYYYLDKSNWRIIILDNTESDPKNSTRSNIIDHGFIDEAQFEWLKKSLETKRKVLVAMHIPMLERSDLSKIREDQKYLEQILENAGNVKYVLAGHFHVYNWHTQINGIEYYILPSISLKNGEGYFMNLKLEK